MHMWVIEHREMYTNDNWEIFEFALTRRVARTIITDIEKFRNLNSKGPHYSYRVKKYVRAK